MQWEGKLENRDTRGSIYHCESIPHVTVYVWTSVFLGLSSLSSNHLSDQDKYSFLGGSAKELRLSSTFQGKVRTFKSRKKNRADSTDCQLCAFHGVCPFSYHQLSQCRWNQGPQTITHTGQGHMWCSMATWTLLFRSWNDILASTQQMRMWQHLFCLSWTWLTL